MSSEPELLIEIWNALRSYIPQKERMEAALSVINLFDTFGDIEELKEYVGQDSYLDKALEDYLEEDEEDEEDEDDY